MTIGIVLAGTGDLPGLDVRVSFPAAVDPQPHVQPLATLLVKPREACFTAATTTVAIVHLEVRDRRVHALSRGTPGDCLAKAIDNQPIDDAAAFEADLEVAVKKAGAA